MSGKSLAAIVIFSCAVLGITSGEISIAEGPQCTICEEGMPCFVNETAPCPPFSNNLGQSDNTSECVCDPGFFMTDNSCVPCAAGYYCPGFYADERRAVTNASMTSRRLLSTMDDGINYARACASGGCPVTVKSTLFPDFPKSNLVNGNLLDSYISGDPYGFPEFGPYVIIDLERVVSVTMVRIYNRHTCDFCIDKLEIRVGNSGTASTYSSNEACATNIPSFLVSKDVTCVLSGRYVSIRQLSMEHFQSSEIEVYGTLPASVGNAGSDIVPCPRNSSSIMGADNVSMCLCDHGYAASNCSQNIPLNASTCLPVCTACEPGKYKAVVSNVVACQDCPANTYSSSTSACTACPPSTESASGSTDVSSCLPSCEPGYTGPAGSCTQCGVGKYKNSSGSSPCTPCPPGHGSWYGESSCTMCVPGKYALDSGNNCDQCPMGKYSTTFAAVGAVSCQECTNGFYSYFSPESYGKFYGFDACLQCPPNSTSRPGDFGFGNVLDSQCSCNAGYALYPGWPWHPTEDIQLPAEQLCQPCAAGTYQPEAVQWREISYSTQSTHPTCLACPAHMTSGPGSAVCVCAAGSYGVPGGPLCEACGPNEFSTLGALTAADCRCSAGYFREQEGSECVPCPVNSYRAFGEQELACLPCASGSTTQYNASDSSALCIVCPADSFVAEAGDCRPCPEHASSLPGTVGSCQCDAGYASEGDSCVPCADGYYKGLPGNEACAACAAGKIGTDVPSRTHENVSCVGCPANTYWALTDTTPVCVNCTTNSQSTSGSLTATSCQCNAGYYAAGGSCQACAPGTFKDTVSSDVACSPCGGSTYTPFSAATECLSCPGNSTGHALSNDAELDCKCDPGFNGSDGGPCAACEPGKFKTESGDHDCVDCGAYAFWPSHAVPTENRCQSCPEHSTRAPDAHGLNILDCHCEAGYWRANESTCLQCPEDYYCPGYLLACPLHSVSEAGSALIDHCRCEAGFFGDASSCAACPANSFCPKDTLSPLACPPNSSTLGLISTTSVSNCTCHAGFHRDETSGVRCRPCGEIARCEDWETVTCPPNSTAPWSARELSECVCDPGFRLQASSDGNMTCTLCTEQEVCREGMSTQCAAGAVNINMRCVCAPGSHCTDSGSSCTTGDSRSCFACPLNHWCYNNSRTACRANEEAPVNSTSRSACRCVDGYFRDALGACAVCPLHHVCKNETRRPVTLYDEHLRTLYTGAIDLSEAVCAAGMFRTSMTDLCKTCPRNFFCPQTGVALPNVVRCPENQFTYESGASSRADCVCLAGFRLLGNNEDARCLPCALGERCQDGEVVEELCHLQNKVASADHESCVCQEGYGLVNFDCLVCAPGFVKPSSGDTPCLPCASGTYAINTTTCAPCPEHSDSRPGSPACQCVPPYEWTSNATCRLCPTDHFWQDRACHACPALATSQPSALMALGSAACRCAIGHVAAPLNVSGSLECSPCANGTYETGGECRQCGHGAWSFAASSTHTACVCNRLPNSSGTCHNQLVDGSCAGECASPPAACTQCEPGHHKPAYSTPGNSESCLACSDGHFQPDFGALACIRCPQNEWHESLGQVSRMSCLCVQGFARPANASEPAANASEAAANASEPEPIGKSPCQACSPGRYKDWLGDQQCLPCDVGRYNPDVQSTICHFCSDATADYEAWLRAIAPDLLAGRADNSSRMVLESNTTVREAAVSVLECVCDIGQEPRTVGDFSVCSRCRQGSFQEHKLHDDCTYCGGTSVEHGHSLLHHYGLPGAGVTESSHCGACPPFSGHNETLVGPGKVIVSDISKCLCFPGHERIFSENSSECQNCSQYMMQPFVSDDACEFCPAGHYFIDRHVVCELCSLPEDGGERHVGLVLNKHDHTLPWGTSEDDCVCRVGYERDFHSQCTACTAGKFRGSNITRHCALCPVDTFQDSTAQQTCITCPLHSSTLSLEGGDSPSDCVCGPGFQPLFLIDSSTGACHACLAGTFRTSRLLNESDAPCFTCPENYYCPLGAQVPVPCPFGELSLAGSGSLSDCQCPPGYGRNTHPVQVAGNESAGEELNHQNTTLRAACTVCARGFFSENMSNSLCPRCPENKTTSFSGATNQSDCKCVPGHGVDTQIPSAACHLCADGSFSAGGDNEPCRSCGWGTQTKPFYMPESDESCVCNAHLGLFTKR